MLTLTEQDRSTLRLRQKTETNKQVYVRITVLLMLDLNLSISTICACLNIDQTTINRYINAYKEQGLSDFLTLHYVGYGGKLSESEEQVLNDVLQKDLHINSQQIITLIETQFGKTYTPSGIAKLMERLDFVYKKTKHTPSKANIQAQEAFLAQMLDIFADIEADEGDSVAYFVDAIHPQHNTRSDYGWIKKGEEFTIPANAGRKRLNINAALNAHNVSDVIIDEAPTINTESTKNLIEKIVWANPFSDIILFHDNARYYYANELKEWLKNTYPQVKQVFLPPYSPNLNLIERLWKFLRKTVISYHFYPTFNEFREEILNFFRNIKKYKKNLKSLLTLNFHIIA
jgi:transposase